MYKSEKCTACGRAFASHDQAKFLFGRCPKKICRDFLIGRIEFSSVCYSMSCSSLRYGILREWGFAGPSQNDGKNRMAEKMGVICR